jgi:hypothetical protein
LNVTSDVDQKTGIFSRGSTGGEDARVTGQFLFLTGACREPPEKRMEPIDGLSAYPQKRYPEIEAADMREFVKQSEADIFMRPFTGLFGQEDHGL